MAQKKERKHRQPKYTQTVISANGIKQCRTEKIILSQLSLFCSLPSKLASSFNLHEEGREYGRFLFVISQFLKSSCQIKRCTAASWWCGPWAKGQFHSLGGFAYRPEITDGHGYMFRVWPAPVTLHYGAPAGAYDRPTPRGTSENSARKGSASSRARGQIRRRAREHNQVIDFPIAIYSRSSPPIAVWMVMFGCLI